MNFLGIDVGTGGSRAVLIDASGRVVASATIEHEPDVWARVNEACDSVVRVAHRVTPDASAAELLNKQYETFRRLYPALKFVAEGTARTAGLA